MVSWLDHVEHDGWKDIGETIAAAQGGHLVWSVGWLIDDAEDHILIAPSLSFHPSDEQTGSMEILVGSIKSIHILF